MAVNRSEWTSPDTWRDPDCIECGGEGAPCCEPPDHPYDLHGALDAYWSKAAAILRAQVDEMILSGELAIDPKTGEVVTQARVIIEDED